MHCRINFSLFFLIKFFALPPLINTETVFVVRRLSLLHFRSSRFLRRSLFRLLFTIQICRLVCFCSIRFRTTHNRKCFCALSLSLSFSAPCSTAKRQIQLIGPSCNSSEHVIYVLLSLHCSVRRLASSFDLVWCSCSCSASSSSLYSYADLPNSVGIPSRNFQSFWLLTHRFEVRSLSRDVHRLFTCISYVFGIWTALQLPLIGFAFTAFILFLLFSNAEIAFDCIQIPHFLFSSAASLLTEVNSIWILSRTRLKRPLDLKHRFQLPVNPFRLTITRERWRGKRSIWLITLDSLVVDGQTERTKSW
jgi:hypothetical protein